MTYVHIFMLCLAVQALVLGKGDYVTATTDNEGGMRLLLIAGRPIGEPIVQVHMPFC
jgi:redox-sensitive bicupin YhaK (pirin superfamily)